MLDRALQACYHVASLSSMIISDKDALARLNSSSNLMNRLKDSSSSKRKNAMGLFVPSSGTFQSSSVTFTNPFPKAASDSVEQKESTSQELVPSNHSLAPVSSPAPITLDDIISGSDSKIKLVTAHNKSLDVLVRTVEMIGTKLDDIKPEKLPSVMSAMAKTIEGIRKEQLELNKERRDRNVHFHFYEPARNKISDYDVIDV